MKKLTFTRQLRTGQTDAENLLWSRLRGHRLLGLKFRRQQPVGEYIVDFFCAEKKLIVELDGGQHQDQAAYDAKRDAWLKLEGYTMLRYWNNEAMGNLEGVLEDICRCAGVLDKGPPSPPAPLPPSRERGEPREAAPPLAPLSTREGEPREAASPLAPPPRGGRGWGEGGATS